MGKSDFKTTMGQSANADKLFKKAGVASKQRRVHPYYLTKHSYVLYIITATRSDRIFFHVRPSAYDALLVMGDVVFPCHYCRLLYTRKLL